MEWELDNNVDPINIKASVKARNIRFYLENGCIICASCNNGDKVTVAENIEHLELRKMKIEINTSKIDINKVQEHIYKMIIHEHVWESVKNSSDVKCKICGIRAMRAYMEVGKCK